MSNTQLYPLAPMPEKVKERVHSYPGAGLSQNIAFRAVLGIAYKGSVFDANRWSRDSPVARMIDYKTALVRGAGIVGGTLLIFFALKDAGKHSSKTEGGS